MSRARSATAAFVAVAMVSSLARALPAHAAWSATGSGSASGAAMSMPNGSTPSGQASGTSVTISWTPATLPDGTAVAGYLISRYDARTGAQQSVGAGCSGVVATTTCTEKAVPSGTWAYTATPVESSWTGRASSDSAPISVT